MTTVRTYGNLAEAGFAKSLLEAAGIPAELADENTYGLGYGPATGGLRLQVLEADLERARKILAEGPDADADSSTPTPRETSDLPLAPKGSRFPAGIFLASGIAFLAILFVVSQLRDKQRAATTVDPNAQQTMEIDRNQDGRPDQFFHYRGQYLSKSNADRNYDGKLDEWQECDWRGNFIRATADNNFDGNVDVWGDFEAGELRYSRADTDFNGVPDCFTEFRHGLPVRVDVKPNGTATPIRTDTLVHGVLTEERVDSDGDGKFDYRIKYDAFANPSEHLPIE